MKLTRVLKSVVACICLASCDSAMCTLVGCSSGITINFPTGTTGPLTINLSSPDAGARSVVCGGNPCIAVQVQNYTPASVRIEVVSAGTSTTRDFTPTYTQAQPNGPKCGPTCLQATVQFN